MKSPFEKGGHRGICFVPLCENLPTPPYNGGNIIYGEALSHSYFLTKPSIL
jgi:hypothetical protein